MQTDNGRERSNLQPPTPSAIRVRLRMVHNSARDHTAQGSTVPSNQDQPPPHSPFIVYLSAYQLATPERWQPVVPHHLTNSGEDAECMEDRGRPCYRRPCYRRRPFKTPGRICPPTADRATNLRMQRSATNTRLDLGPCGDINSSKSLQWLL
jgi:hypothetical protein